MAGRFQPENGADSAQGLADAIATVESSGALTDLIEDARTRGYWQGVRDGRHLSIVPRCIACSEPALPDSIYCKGHDRLMDYVPTDDRHWAAND